MKKLLFNFQLALEGVAANRLRAFLTALGIVFGVAAVIAMLAIGTGARETILAQMRLIGANNIVVTSLMEAGKEDDDVAAQSAGQEKNTKPWSPGLNLGDVRAISTILPGVEAISPEIVLPTTVIRDGKIGKSRAVGVTNAFFELNNLDLDRGRMFHDVHQEKGDPVCIIGQDIVRRYFSEGNPIGERIKCGQTWLRIIGVIKERIAKKDQLKNLGIRDYNQDIYVPLQTALIRFKDRSFAHSRNIGGNGNNNAPAENYHQLDRMVIRVADSDQLLATSNVVARLLKRRHQTVLDYEMAVPEKMLEAQQQTQETFNKVLAFIAGISLLVGGIGIMNIMLASVLERTKEIGTRRSLGATQQDIVQQFLLEAIFISLLGGLTGILLGVGASTFIAANYEIPTEVSAWSVILSFGVASVIGLVFGLFPARRAAMLDPIKALRSD